MDQVPESALLTQYFAGPVDAVSASVGVLPSVDESGVLLTASVLDGPRRVFLPGSKFCRPTINATTAIAVNLDNATAVVCGGWNATTIPSNVLQKVSLMSLFMVIALLGNSAMLVVLFRSRKRRQRSVHAFFISLAASDILIAIFSMPTEVFWDVFGGWLFGNAACKMLTYLQCILFASTAFIHMSISFDRYEAVCKPMFFAERSARNRWMIGWSWLLALIVAVPQLFIFLEVETGTRADGTRIHACRSGGYTAEWQRKLYVTWNTFYMFLVPLCIMSFCYLRIAGVVWRYDGKNSTLEQASLNAHFGDPSSRTTGKRSNTFTPAKLKTIQVTVCVVFSYTFCWIPYFTVALLNVWSDYRYKEQINSSLVGPLAQCLCWFSSCINPFIYGFFSLPRHYRRKPCGLVVCCRDAQFKSPSSNESPNPRMPVHVPHVTTAVANQMFPLRSSYRKPAKRVGFNGRLFTQSENDGDRPSFKDNQRTAASPVYL
ncbi:putative Vasopressin V1a receptor [Hypsibius exemplaris]|uniref:Vasopressin V1a receptor n=1 Tax=Hypsibius exemplaris TaxID=2072580 RepID=A0A1W0X2A9_HYPEX|nr:putative Vasopressin V1a receptor [Hypsibius exemplaris]